MGVLSIVEIQPPLGSHKSTTSLVKMHPAQAQRTASLSRSNTTIPITTSNATKMANLQRTSSSAQINHISPLLAPALSTTLQLAHLSSLVLHKLSFVTLHILIRTSLLAIFTLQYTLTIAAILLQQAYRTSTLILRHSWKAVKHVLRVLWKATERTRNRLFFEFIVFILGCGNGLCLVLFWPGWILVGGVGLGLWWACG